MTSLWYPKRNLMETCCQYTNPKKCKISICLPTPMSPLYYWIQWKNILEHPWPLPTTSQYTPRAMTIKSVPATSTQWFVILFPSSRHLIFAYGLSEGGQSVQISFMFSYINNKLDDSLMKSHVTSNSLHPGNITWLWRTVDKMKLKS